MTVCAIGACRLTLVVSKGVDKVYDRVDVAAELGDFAREDVEGGALVKIRLLIIKNCQQGTAMMFP